MKISVITVCLNSAATIEKTIQSVLSQDYHDLEYIIIDGKSSDNTLDIVERYAGKISRILSEKDEGIYFALNKAISLAEGEVIGIFHADDFYSDPKVLAKVAGQFTKKRVDSVYADLQYVHHDDTSKVFRNWKSGEYREGLFLKGWMPPHP